MTAGFPPKDSSRSTLFASLAASGRVESEKASHLRVGAHWLGPLLIAQKLSPITWTMHRTLSMAKKPILSLLCLYNTMHKSKLGERLQQNFCLWNQIVHVQMVSLQSTSGQTAEACKHVDCVLFCLSALLVRTHVKRQMQVPMPMGCTKCDKSSSSTVLPHALPLPHNLIG